MERPSKRARVSTGSSEPEETEGRPNRIGTPLNSLNRSISPPLRTRIQPTQVTGLSCPELVNDETVPEKSAHDAKGPAGPASLIPSPVQLTHIRDYPASKGYNVDAVRLSDILGDPMIRECWQFNYMFDVDFLMRQFDEDVRSLVKVKVVHGSWKKESPNRMLIDEGCSRYPNVEPITAYLPDPFGTHHSKMMILLRHDDSAQVIIHTANMIPGDWANMTQAVWQSPMLPLEKLEASGSVQTPTSIGTGARFKRDLLAYLDAYGRKKTGELVHQLKRYDFGAVRAALIASVPCRKKPRELDSEKSTLWGWPALKDIIGRIPIHKQATKDGSGRSHIVTQISSVATLGQTDKWLREVFFKALDPKSTNLAPKYSIIFPTPDEIRRSLNGYSSGNSIHMKTQSAPQAKQLQYIRPYLCQWAGDNPSDSNMAGPSQDKPLKREAGRGRAAPHIKTYIRFSNEETMDSIDWAMVTSANLSTQAWGAATNPNGEVRIQSFEIGVVVWPSLFAENLDAQGTESSTLNGISEAMVPCFKSDQPVAPIESFGPRKLQTVIGFRMPYDLPLMPYHASDEPWCATASHHIPDWSGMTW